MVPIARLFFLFACSVSRASACPIWCGVFALISERCVIPECDSCAACGGGGGGEKEAKMLQCVQTAAGAQKCQAARDQGIGSGKVCGEIGEKRVYQCSSQTEAYEACSAAGRVLCSKEQILGRLESCAQ